MTSLLGRLIPLFVGARRVEDLFTETVARLFERRPDLCLSWLDSLDLTTPVSEEGQRYIRVTTQKPFVALEESGSGSRPDLILEVHYPHDDTEQEGSSEVVMIESKIGSWEGPEQLKRYAGLLDRMRGFDNKVLLYVTRAYDPKDKERILSEVGSVRFEQLRWHDFYRFLHTVEKDVLVEEIMTFMEEQGMASSYRFSTADLMALSGVPRSFELFDETLGGEVRTELESFAGNKARRETHSISELRWHLRYGVRASLHGRDDLFCEVGYQLGRVDESAHASILRIPADGYPMIYVFLEAQPGAAKREASVSAMENIASNEDWETYNLNNPAGWAGVRRARSLATLLAEEDHVAAAKRFFIESIRQLREELTAFKQERPDLPWNGA